MKRFKIVLALLILGGAFAYLMTQALTSSMVYYLKVDEVFEERIGPKQRVRVNGNVVEGSIEKDAANLTVDFTVRGEAERSGAPVHTIPVTYQGEIPDMFQDGADVVVEGWLDDTGRFEADVLLAKCASKYEPQEFQAPAAGPGGAAPADPEGGTVPAPGNQTQPAGATG